MCQFLATLQACSLSVMSEPARILFRYSHLHAYSSSTALLPVKTRRGSGMLAVLVLVVEFSHVKVFWQKYSKMWCHVATETYYLLTFVPTNTAHRALQCC